MAELRKRGGRAMHSNLWRVTAGAAVALLLGALGFLAFALGRSTASDSGTAAAQSTSALKAPATAPVSAGRTGTPTIGPTASPTPASIVPTPIEAPPTAGPALSAATPSPALPTVTLLPPVPVAPTATPTSRCRGIVAGWKNLGGGAAISYEMQVLLDSGGLITVTVDGSWYFGAVGVDWPFRCTR